MRKVYLTRDKSFVGCASKLCVWVEDKAAGKVNINETPCRLVGYIKNGETVSFEIGNEATEVYITAVKASRHFRNDCCIVPEGDTDLKISGKRVFDHENGNPFRFHRPGDKEKRKSRYSTRFKVIVAVAAPVVIGIVLTALMNFRLPKTFNCADFDITLSSEFEAKVENGSYFFNADKCCVSVYEYCFDSYTGVKGMSDDEFLAMLKEFGCFPSTAEFAVVEGLKVVECTAISEGGYTCRYFTVFMRDDEGAFLFEFGAFPSDYEEYRASFIEWAKSIKLK
ncbi:MAG: hypothetical protein ACI3XI_05485 [Eubacteriales bacterium]